MHLDNIENRAEAEKKAVSDILNYMKEAGGEFIYSESFHKYPAFGNKFIWDGDLSSFMAGTICEALPDIKKVAYGRTASDNANAALVGRIEKANKIFGALCDATKIYPVENLTKREIYDMLPEELQKLFWSCRKPIYRKDKIIPCNRCKTCREMERVGINK